MYTNTHKHIHNADSEQMLSIANSMELADAVNSEFNGVSRFGKNLGEDGPHYILIRLFNFSYLFQVSADSREKLWSLSGEWALT